MTNPLVQLAALGQSVWLDHIRRSLIEDGALARLIHEDRLSGLTSNPAIFEQALAHGREYDAAIGALAARGLDATAIYEDLALDDIAHAADLFYPEYRRSDGRDGFVSFEVSPHLAHDSSATIREAHRLQARLARPNIMIKVPATRAGLVAIASLIEDGLHVNVTLLFGVGRYREVVDAVLTGLERRLAAGQPIAAISSVASFFLSRIDTHIDALLDAHPDSGAPQLRGQAAIASARLAYQEYRRWRDSPRWDRLAAQGARPPRLLWASTSTKDPSYSDVKYVEALIAADTVTTLPPDTMDAYRNHGRPAVRIDDDLDQAHALSRRLTALGIDLEAVAATLEIEGVRKFVEPFDKLLATLRTKSAIAR